MDAIPLISQILVFSPELKIACFETFCDTHLGQCQKHTHGLDF